MLNYDITFKRIGISDDNKVIIDPNKEEYKNQTPRYTQVLLENRNATREQINKLFTDLIISNKRGIIYITINERIIVGILKFHEPDDIIQNPND